MIAQTLQDSEPVNPIAAEEIRHRLLCVLGAAESNYNLLLSSNCPQDAVELQRLTIEKLTELIFRVSNLVNSSPTMPGEQKKS